jgi:DNA polymerase III alpha subunit
VAVPELPEFDRAERVRGESRSTGLWFSGHPLDLWTPAESWRGVSDAVALPQLAGRRVAVAGMPCAMRRVETRSGGQMLFLTLADRTGLAECALFPDAYRALAGQIRGQIVRVEGRVDETLGAVTVTVESARVLTE